MNARWWAIEPSWAGGCSPRCSETTCTPSLMTTFTGHRCTWVPFTHTHDTHRNGTTRTTRAHARTHDDRSLLTLQNAEQLPSCGSPSRLMAGKQTVPGLDGHATFPVFTHIHSRIPVTYAVYSFGLAMWEVVHNDFAFSGFDDLVAFREVPRVVCARAVCVRVRVRRVARGSLMCLISGRYGPNGAAAALRRHDARSGEQAHSAVLGSIARPTSHHARGASHASQLDPHHTPFLISPMSCRGSSGRDQSDQDHRRPRVARRRPVTPNTFLCLMWPTANAQLHTWHTS